VLSGLSTSPQFPYHYGGMQRLFSTFPNGWPGFGLLLLRLGVGIALISLGAGGLVGTLPDPIIMIRNIIEAAAGILLLAGLWTPVAGGVVALDELWIAFTVDHFPQNVTWIHVFLAVLTAGVAMLGPGAWSIDARLFGRKRFDIDGTRGRKRPTKGW
jgi:putative oxidoreductase